MPKYLDLFAGAGGLSEGFIRAGYEPIAHVEMDAAACYTLRTRTAYHWLKKGNNLAPYTKYLAGDIPRKDFYALVPKEILNSVLNYDERRGVDLGGFRQIVLVLIERLAVREVFGQFCDELLLLSCGRTVIWDKLHTLPRCDVAQISGGPAGAFDIGTLEDQSCHSSSSQSCSWRERAYFSNERRPFVAFTLRTLCARLRFKSSRSISNASAMIPLVMSCSTHLVKSLRAI